ncbi:hypothetical protein EMIT079MI2_90166 [Bacillus sp. IT-79MI2]
MKYNDTKNFYETIYIIFCLTSDTDNYEEPCYNLVCGKAL